MRAVKTGTPSRRGQSLWPGLGATHRAPAWPLDTVSGQNAERCPAGRPRTPGPSVTEGRIPAPICSGRPSPAAPAPQVSAPGPGLYRFSVCNSTCRLASHLAPTPLLPPHASAAARAPPAAFQQPRAHPRAPPAPISARLPALTNHLGPTDTPQSNPSAACAGLRPLSCRFPGWNSKPAHGLSQWDARKGSGVL